MQFSWRMGRLAGIDVYLHFTFLLLLGFIGLGYLMSGDGVLAAVEGVGFVAALFGCVLLHEFGHALTARHFGIPTKDITLLPIGGVARLERMPEQPWRELAIALAGPAVNVAIAAVLLGVLMVIGSVNTLLDVSVLGGHFLARLLVVNVMLVVFNMLPAFPMDGGRVLRALLALKLNYVRATEIAANVGKFMAILMGLAGAFYFHNFFMVLIAVFVYFAGKGELFQVRQRWLRRTMEPVARFETAPLGNANQMIIDVPFRRHSDSF